jgi:Sensors of blue-light using FAD
MVLLILLMLIQLTYASRTSRTLTSADLPSILAASQRNNARTGVTGALCLTNGIFLQQLEGDRTAVSLLYHRILLDPRHRDPAILDFSEIASRKFTNWSMGSLSSVESNRAIYLKYSRSASFDPYTMSPTTLRAFFDEIMNNASWLG